MVSIDKAQTELDELAENRKLAESIALAMSKQGHRWHDTPKDRTPTDDEVQGLIGYLCNRMISALREHPEVDRQRVGTGGISVYYWRWPSGSEEIEINYSPEGAFRCLPRD